MVIDTSALIAILNNEPERRRFSDAIEQAAAPMMSAASFVEASIVAESVCGYDGVRDLEHLITRAKIEIVPVYVDQAHIASHAYRRYGKGKHPAKLNFGDCFSYALAKSLGSPLLFKGEDFVKTDVERVDLLP